MYKVHCTNCGNVVTADQMAINIDKILSHHLELMKSRSGVLKKAADTFGQIRLGIYKTNFELVTDGVLNNNILRINGLYILEHIWDRYKIDYNLSKLTESQSNTSVETVDDDPFMDLDDDFGLGKGNDVSSKVTIPDSVLDSLCVKMNFYKETGAEEDKVKLFIKDMLVFLISNQEEEFLKCEISFSYAHNDISPEQKFISGITVTYGNNEKIPYQHMVCPYCGDEFYIDAGQYEEKIIVMLGSSRVGKTAYLASLIDQLIPEYGQSEFAGKITFIESNDYKYRKFKETELKTYRYNRKMVKTNVNKDTVPLFSIKVQIEHTEKMIILTFVDLPGETFVPSGISTDSVEADGRFIVNHRKICNSADAFWMCVAPSQIDARLNQENSNAKEDYVETDVNMVLNNIQNMVRLMGSEKTKIPTAIMVTMSDKIEQSENLYFERFDIKGILHCVENSKEVQFQVDRYAAMANNVKRYLESQYVRNVTPMIRNIFELLNYFSVAAYGIDLEDTEANRQRQPFGVLLPFVWTLAAMGYIVPSELKISTIHEGFLFNRTEITKTEYIPVSNANLYMNE